MKAADAALRERAGRPAAAGGGGATARPGTRGGVVDGDPRLVALRDRVAEVAGELRAHALAIDADPDGAALPAGSAAVALIRAAALPAERRTAPEPPEVLGDYRGTCLERVVATLELARGDAGALLGAPGPALAGIVVDALGSTAQRDLFHARVADGRTRTFFAMTEPAHGSDATSLESRLERTPDGFALSGRKRYIGNAARAGIGVVFARTGRSPLTIRAVLVERPAGGWQGRRLDTLGLRGAWLSEIAFDGHPVSEDQLLGQHLPVSRRGLWGALQTFNNVRIQVGAMAVGTALAMLDRVGELAPGAPGGEVLRARAEAARELAYRAAAEVDRDPDARAMPAMAKLTGSRLPVAVAHWAAAVLGPGGLPADPLLEKWSRDAYGFEFMEGTGNMQRLHIADGHVRSTGHRPAGGDA
ncbi:acyl-CoA dehydrogenase family protein [Streptomyces sp. NPDC090057]|uniref:acyl-CoA dehydrogenase family protein n=1 Tax=Streptomyces sp. NPDC090057 TaxID=3365935 RepID=UPI0037F3515D